MGTHLGNTGYWEDMPRDLLGADEPLTSMAAWVMRENIAHLTSVYPQYRVNWVATANEVRGQTNGDDPYLISFHFPLTIPQFDRPVSIDLRVAAKISGSTTSATVRARVMWAHQAAQATTSAIDTPTLVTDTDTTTSTGGEWVLDSQTDLGGDITYRDAWEVYTAKDGSLSSPVAHAMARCDVVLDGTYTGSGNTYLLGVQVREFL